MVLMANLKETNRKGVLIVGNTRIWEAPKTPQLPSWRVLGGWEAPFGLTWLLEGCGQGYLNLLFHVRCSWVVLLPGFMRVMFRAIGTYYSHIDRTKSQWVLGRSSR